MPTADSLNRLGVEFFLKGDHEAARLHYLAALRLEANFIPALVNLSTVLATQNNLPSAIACLRKYLAIMPNDWNYLGNLGNMLMRLKKYLESREVMERVAELAPDSPSTWYNLALLSYRENRSQEALEHLDKAIALGARGHTIENDKAHIILAIGEDLSSAWKLYEARWATMIHLPPWDFHIPEWTGQDLKGKTVLFHAEQGFGDTIMTARFARDLVARGAKVAIGLPGSLCRLFEIQNWKDVGVLDIERLDPKTAAAFDYHTPMYSAMRWLGVEQHNISAAPYLTVVPEGGPRVSTPNSFNIGICWASGIRGGDMDWRRRHAPLFSWLPLTCTLPDVQLYSLQKGVDAEEIQAIGADGLIIDETPNLKDWSDTAALISQLDLVVTVDTAVAHLAGAMGKPVWMISQYEHCWRWWNITSGDGRPWYSSMNIIRQTVPDDWDSQLLQVCERLRIQRTIPESLVA